MRLGEIRNLRWSHIDKERSMIRLPSDITKERGEKTIPINHHVKNALNELPRAPSAMNLIMERDEAFS